MKNEEMARLFSEATPYIQKYHGKTMVVKYGGNAMINEELKNAVMNDLAAMALCGFVACPADAAPEVRARADYICPQRGGEGAVRGAVEKILRGDGRWNDAVKKAFQVEL